MASSVDLVRPLEHPLLVAGFTLLNRVAAKTLWSRDAVLQSRPNTSRTIVTLNVSPVGRTIGVFNFEPWVILDGRPLHVKIQPTTFVGGVAEFIDTQLPQYDILMELEDFYPRGNREAPEPQITQPLTTSVAFR